MMKRVRQNKIAEIKRLPSIQGELQQLVNGCLLSKQIKPLSGQKFFGQILHVRSHAIYSHRNHPIETTPMYVYEAVAIAILNAIAS